MTTLESATQTPATIHPGRCYCPKFAPGHAPGLRTYWTSCKGDAHREHTANTCPACVIARVEASTCETCRSGCMCSGPGTGCGHYACWGQEADGSCPEAQQIRA